MCTLFRRLVCAQNKQQSFLKKRERIHIDKGGLWLFSCFGSDGGESDANKMEILTD